MPSGVERHKHKGQKLQGAKLKSGGFGHYKCKRKQKKYVERTGTGKTSLWDEQHHDVDSAGHTITGVFAKLKGGGWGNSAWERSQECLLAGRKTSQLDKTQGVKVSKGPWIIYHALHVS